MLTKKDLQRIQDMMNETFERKFEVKFEEKFEEKFEQIRLYFSNEVLQFKDDILHEIKDIRTDLDIAIGKLYTHEERLQMLEKLSHKHTT